MKVNVSQTVEVSDDQLKAIADLADGKVSARRAKRVEARDFVWANGSGWETCLTDAHNYAFGGRDEAQNQDELGLLL